MVPSEKNVFNRQCAYYSLMRGKEEYTSLQKLCQNKAIKGDKIMKNTCNQIRVFLIYFNKVKLFWGKIILSTKAHDRSTDEVTLVCLAQINKYQDLYFYSHTVTKLLIGDIRLFSVEFPSCNDNTESSGGHCCWLFCGDQACRGHTSISSSPMSSLSLLYYILIAILMT